MDPNIEHNIFLDQVVSDEGEAYGLYKYYAQHKGFSVRKGKQYYAAGSKTLLSKDYYCSKQGYKDDRCEGEAIYIKLDTRTGCLAMIRFKIEKNGQWKVSHFVAEHNHEFAGPEEIHLLRCFRTIPVEKAIVIDSMVNAGVKIAEDGGVKNKVGGVEIIGYTKRDCYNYINKQKMILIEGGDGQSLVNYFKFKVGEEGMFYWDVEPDEENQ